MSVLTPAEWTKYYLSHPGDLQAFIKCAEKEANRMVADITEQNARIAELEGALKEYANPANWRFNAEGQRNIWWGDYAGPVQAKAALK